MFGDQQCFGVRVRCSAARFLPAMLPVMLAGTVVLGFGCERAGPESDGAFPPVPAQPTAARPDLRGEEAPAEASAETVAVDESSAPAIAVAAPAGEAASPPADAPAKIAFERLFHDYGDIWDVGKYVSEFSFKNVGGTALNILAVRAGCGCTTTSLRKNAYEPGESGTVDLVFTPQGTGRQVKTLTVVSDDPDEPTVELSIGANIREFAFAEPRIMRFGTVPLGESLARRVLIRSADPEARLTGVSVGGLNPNAVVARIVPGETQFGGRQGIGVVEIIVHERNGWGAVYSMVEVTTQGTTPDGESLEHVTKIACAASVFGSVHASDNMIRVEIVRPGGSFERVLRVHSGDGNAFALSGEAMSNAMPISVEVRPVEGQPQGTAYDVFVRGDAGSFMGLIRGTLILRTDVQGEEELRMSIQGIVREV